MTSVLPCPYFRSSTLNVCYLVEESPSSPHDDLSSNFWWRWYAPEDTVSSAKWVIWDVVFYLIKRYPNHTRSQPSPSHHPLLPQFLSIYLILLRVRDTLELSDVIIPRSWKLTYFLCSFFFHTPSCGRGWSEYELVGAIIDGGSC